MTEKELVLGVADLNVVSVTCANCGQGAIFDLEKVKPNPQAGRSVTHYLKFECNCGDPADNEVAEILTSFWSVHQKLKSLKKHRVEFRVRPSLSQIATF